MSGYYHCIITLLFVFHAIAVMGQKPGTPPSLFESDTVLPLVIKGDIKDLFGNRVGKAIYYPMELTVTGPDDRTEKLQIKMKTRGNFRRKAENCSYPPLWLNFDKDEIPKTSIFSGQNKLKLVVPCQGETYLLREYLTYKLFNLITAASYRVRLVHVDFIDTSRQKVYASLLAFILEDDDQMASRIGGEIESQNLIRSQQTDTLSFLRMAIFEYMIGNTDWSVPYRHNIRIVKLDDRLITVPYDFDHAGLVGAPYAKPAPELQLSSVSSRRYRGYCLEDPSVTDPIVEDFLELKEMMLAQLAHPLLKQSHFKSASKYIDSFYKQLQSRKRWYQDLQYPCLESGTGNVIIQGLNHD